MRPLPPLVPISFIFTARKRSLGQDNIFTSVCQEFCPRGGVCSAGGAWSWGGLSAPGVPGPRGVCSQDGSAPRGGVPAGDPLRTARRYASYWNAFLL